MAQGPMPGGDDPAATPRAVGAGGSYAVNAHGPVQGLVVGEGATVHQHFAAAQQAAPLGVPPPPPQGIFGREQALADLRAALQLEDAEATDIPPVAVRGMGGVGKTTLAIALARAPGVLEQFPDGVLWAGLGPQPSLRHQLDLWGRAVGIDLLPLPTEEACSQRLRDALGGRRVLIVVDDVWEAGHGRLLLVGGPRSRTLLTTRELTVANDLATRARVYEPRTISPEASLALLAALVPEVVQADEAIARRLCQRLEYLPLALTLAGRYLANAAEVPTLLMRLVSELIERTDAALELVQSEGRPGLSDAPVSLRAILGMSVERLDRTDQERFAMLAVFGGEPLSWTSEAAAAVWECSAEDADRTVLRFIQRGLVDRWGDRYRMHALLADYAAALMEERNL